MRRLTRDAESLTDVRPGPAGGQCVGDGVALELIGLPPQRDDGSERGGRVRIVTHRDQLKLMTRIASTFVEGVPSKPEFPRWSCNRTEMMCYLFVHNQCVHA